MLFRLNQAPDVFYTRMLNLLGFEQFPAAAARADLTFWSSGSRNETVVIPAGTQVATSGTIGETRVFTTLDDTAIVPPRLMGALTSEGDDRFTDIWEDLSVGLTSVKVFPSEPMVAGDCFYLGFENSLAGNAIRLNIQASVEGIGVNPGRPPLVWESWQGEGWVAATIPSLLGPDEVADSTGGLNRDGSIVLLLAAEHQPLTLGGVRAHWIRARLLPPTPERPAYRATPQVRRVTVDSMGGTVVAEHSEPVTDDVLGKSTGKPDQSFRCSRTPVLPRQADETIEVEHDGEYVEWTEVSDFVDSDRNDRHFAWDSFTGEIRFGPLIRYPDGSMRQHGAVPPEGARIRANAYRTGGGAAGNVGAGTLTALRTSLPYIARVQNLTSARGGVDAETVENVKRRGPQSLRAGGRAVTVSDFERLTAQADSRVGRVRCLPPVRPGDPVRLLVVPSIRQPAEQLQLDHFALPDDMIQRIADYLDGRRILGSKIEVGTPYYQGVTVAALVSARPGRPPSLVQDRAMRALYDFINPLSGGPEGLGWSFDVDLNAASIFQLLEAVEGVERVDEVLFFEYDLRNQERMGFGKELVKLAPDSLFLSTNHQVIVK
jgi:predicted phage baseplate assembly protein